jgi:hypothetical protein
VERDARTAAFLDRLAKQRPETAAALRARLGDAEPAPSTPGVAPAPQARARAQRPPQRQPQHHGPKRTRKERSQLRRAALQRRESNYLQRLTQRVRDLGGHGVGIRAIPLRVWIACAQVIADPTGRAARIQLRRLQNRTAAGAILRAALQPAEPEQGAAGLTAGRSWASMRTRRIAALGVALAMLAQPTRRRGPWGAVVMGIPRGAFAALLRDPYDSREKGTPAITTLFGIHRPGASADSSQAGYFVALHAAGLAYRQQLPAHEAHAYEVQGPSGHATNRYWLVSDTIACIESDQVRELAIALAQLAELDAAQLGAQLRRECQAPPLPS